MANRTLSSSGDSRVPSYASTDDTTATSHILSTYGGGSGPFSLQETSSNDYVENNSGELPDEPVRPRPPGLARGHREERSASFLRSCFKLLHACRPTFRSASRFRRFPSSKAAWLVFLMFFLYGIAEFSVTLILFFSLNVYHKLNPPQTVAVYLGARFLGFTLFPVMGFLADTFFGRYKVLLVSLHIAWVGSALQSFCFAFIDPYLDKDPTKYAYGKYTSWPDTAVIMLAVSYGILWVGFTGIRVNLIPFGVDQLPEASGGELSSYFHWYYWCINAGYLFASMIIPELYKVTALSFTFLITNFCFSCIIILLVLLQSKLSILPKVGNPFKLVYKVSRYAFKTKRPRYTSAFQLGQARPSRLDLAKVNHGGPFTLEQVEDVKTFFRILLILLSFFGYFAIFSQIQSTYLLESMRMQLPDGYHEKCPDHVAPSYADTVNKTVDCQFWRASPSVWLGYANIIPVLILVPLLDRLIYPCLAGQTPSMLTRIAIGKIFLLVSIAVAIGVETYRVKVLADMLKNTNELVINAIPFHTGSSTTLHVASPARIYLIIPQYLLFAFAEVLSNITAVEFIYAQSPAIMKGILLGLLFWTEGIAMGFASMFIWLQDAFPDFSFFSFYGNSNLYYKHVVMCSEEELYTSCKDSPLFSYIVFLVVAVVSVIGFVVSALRYKLRRRDPDSPTPWFYGGYVERSGCNCCFQ